MKITILGTGIYGISLALTCNHNHHQVTLWTENPSLEKHFLKKHNLKPIIDIEIPKNINVTSNIKEAISNTDLIIIASSAKYIEDISNNIKHNFNITTPICIASKGILNNKICFLSDIIKNILKGKHIAVISGPTFAIDLINKEPVALSVSSTSRKALKTINLALANEYLKLRPNNDLYGTQLVGSIKNTIAIASGIIDGLGYNESTRAFLITESLHDIKELLEKLECNPKTILSFAGIGDLILTASSSKSRNYQFGILLGKKSSKKEIEDYLNNNTTEGYYTLLSIKELIKNRKINIPIINIIYDIILNHKDPQILIDFLINKD